MYQPPEILLILFFLSELQQIRIYLLKVLFILFFYKCYLLSVLSNSKNDLEILIYIFV